MNTPHRIAIAESVVVGALSDFTEVAAGRADGVAVIVVATLGARSLFLAAYVDGNRRGEVAHVTILDPVVVGALTFQTDIAAA